MAELKLKSSGYLGLIHSLIGGFTFPLIFDLIAFTAIQGILKNSYYVVSYVEPITSLFILWLGAWYSAERLRKKYIINNPKKVAAIATIYNFVFVIFVSLGLDYITAGGPQSPNLNLPKILFAILGYIIFYWLSQNYFSKQQIQSTQNLS